MKLWGWVRLWAKEGSKIIDCSGGMDISAKPRGFGKEEIGGGKTGVIKLDCTLARELLVGCPAMQGKQNPMSRKGRKRGPGEREAGRGKKIDLERQEAGRDGFAQGGKKKKLSGAPHLLRKTEGRGSGENWDRDGP